MDDFEYFYSEYQDGDDFAWAYEEAPGVWVVYED